MKSKYKIEEYKNKIINKWKVLDFSHLDSKDQQYWLCECTCGNIKAIRTSHLIRSISKGCCKCKDTRFISNKSMHWKGGKFISSTCLTMCKLAAIRRKLEFNITIEDLENQWLLQNGKCAYTNIELTLPKKSRDFEANYSIDRIDSSIGYIKNNIHWVLKEINVMKMDLKEDRFLELCKIVTENNI